MLDAPLSSMPSTSGRSDNAIFSFFSKDFYFFFFFDPYTPNCLTNTFGRDFDGVLSGTFLKMATSMINSEEEPLSYHNRGKGHS